MVDVLNVAKKKKAIVHFLANAGLFSNPIGNWFFSTFYCIKVERPKDVDGRKIDNAAAFQKSSDFLSRGGTLYIAAEGGSKLERRLRKLKTGGVRIAFDTMQKTNWELPLCFLPVGITYENAKLARYDLFYNFGEPIYVADYKEQYDAEPKKTIKKLTSDIQARMQDLLLHTEPEDDDVDKIVQKLEVIHKNENGNDHASQFFISKKWIAKLLDFKNNDHSKYQTIQASVNTYCKNIVEHKLSDKSIQEKSNWLQYTTLVCTSLFAFIGWINNLPAFFLPDFIMRKTKLYPGYTSTVKLLLVITIFPLTYWLQYKLLSAVLGYKFMYVLYLGIAIILGFFALWWGRIFAQLKKDRNWLSLKRTNKQLTEAIYEQRKQIVDTVFSQIGT